MNSEGPQSPPQPNYAPPNYQNPQYQQQPARAKGLAVTALVVGIVAFLTGLIPVLGIILGLVAVAFGIIALVKNQPKGLAITGLALGAAGLIASLLATTLVGATIDSASEELEQIAAEEVLEEPEEAAPAEPEPEPEAEPEPTERLTLDDGWEVSSDEYGISTLVNGYVSNNSDEAITNYVQITFDTYDADGANLGTCLANTNTIDANGKWKFEAFCFDDTEEIADVKFKEITGF